MRLVLAEYIEIIFTKDESFFFLYELVPFPASKLTIPL